MGSSKQLVAASDEKGDPGWLGTATLLATFQPPWRLHALAPRAVDQSLQRLPLHSVVLAPGAPAFVPGAQHMAAHRRCSAGEKKANETSLYPTISRDPTDAARA